MKFKLSQTQLRKNRIELAKANQRLANQRLGLPLDNVEDTPNPSKRPPKKSRQKDSRLDYSAPVNFVAGGIQRPGQFEVKINIDKDEQTQDVSNVDNSQKAKAPPQIPEKKQLEFKGIGAKLLLQMGFEPGKGLGKSLQGITNPLEARLRKGRGAIGRYGKEANGTTLTKRQKRNTKRQHKMALRRARRAAARLNRKKNVPEPDIETSSNDMSDAEDVDMSDPEQKNSSGYKAIGYQYPPEDSVEELNNKSSTVDTTSPQKKASNRYKAIAYQYSNDSVEKSNKKSPTNGRTSRGQKSTRGNQGIPYQYPDDSVEKSNKRSSTSGVTSREQRSSRGNQGIPYQYPDDSVEKSNKRSSTSGATGREQRISSGNQAVAHQYRHDDSVENVSRRSFNIDMTSSEQRNSSGNQAVAHQYRHDDYGDSVNRRSFINDMPGPEQRISSGNQDTAHQYHRDDYDDNVNRRSFNIDMTSSEQRISSGNQDTAHQYHRDDYDDNINRSFNIDMAGSEQRISSGNQDTAHQYHHDDSVERVNSSSSSNSILPELRSNLNSIIDKCEQNIIENYKKIQDLSDKGIALDAEKRNIRKVIEQHDQLIQTLDTVVNIFENFVVNDDRMSLDETAEAFRRLQDQNHNNYMAYELQKIASGFVIPKFASSMATWEALMDPTKYLDSIKQWKDILSMRDNIEDTRRSTPYCELILNAWIPPVKRAIQEWDCREPEPLTDFLDIWVPLIPLKLIVDELKMIVLEKLTAEVTKWDPQTDIPVHRWIYSWLPLLGDKINTAIISILKRDLPFTSIQRLITQKLAEFISAGPESSLSFTELVEKKCTERDIEFIPTGNRYQDRYDVYKIGNFQAFISVDVLYVKQSESNWKATTLDDLLNTAK